MPLKLLIARLECSKSTLNRVINVLKDAMRVPVVFDALGGGYRDALATGVNVSELQGLWSTPTALRALAVMQLLLKNASNGLLSAHLGEAATRLRFPAIGSRKCGFCPK